jgi:uncharacterized membrane protein YuzA (DUF378 family)
MAEIFGSTPGIVMFSCALVGITGIFLLFKKLDD